MSAKSELKIGIVGLGAIGCVHADAYKATGKGELAAVCDINSATAERIGEKYNIKKVFTDYNKLLQSDIDAVSICTSNATHMEIAVAALKAGKHVLLEKPMALNAEQATQICQAADQNNTVMQIGMVWRYYTMIETLKRYIDSGVLGEIYHIRLILIRRRGIPGLGGWFTTKELSGGGPLIDLGTHWFDIAMSQTGYWNPTSVTAQTYAKFGSPLENYHYIKMWAGPPRFDGVCDVEDYAAGFVRFGEKATLDFNIAWAANTTDQTCIEFLGDKGGAKLFGDPKLQIYTESLGQIVDISPKYDETANMYESQIAGFIAACNGQPQTGATASQGLTVMKLIDAVYKSSQNHKEIYL